MDPGRGAEFQALGEWGESVFKVEMDSHQIAAAKLRPDPGEDFLIEIGGYQAIRERTRPLTALVQIKARTIEGEPDASQRLGGIERERLQRWTAQQLPVFLVLVLPGERPAFYLRSIDSVVEEELGGADVAEHPDASLSVRMRRVADIGQELRRAVESFYSDRTLDYSALTDHQREDRCFEVISRRKGATPLLRAEMHHWSVHWKAERRPQHFAALLKELGRQAAIEYEGTSKPPWVCFHIFRTLRKADVSQMAANVDWTDTTRRDAVFLVDMWGGSCPRVRVGYESEEALDYIASITGSREEFLDHAAVTATRLDRLARQLVAAGAASGEVWTDEFMAAYREADRGWDAGILPPLDVVHIESYVGRYISILWTHRRFFVELREDPDPRMERWRRETLEELEGFLGSVLQLLRAAGWRG
jgi:hypothetical protein